MLNQSKNGIVCDYCNNHCQDDFIYYSLDFYKIDISDRYIISNPIKVKSIDFCNDCMDIWKDRIKLAYRKPINNRLHCDISGSNVDAKSMSYYLCKVSKIEVSFNTASYVCNECKKPVPNIDVKCCSGEYTRKPHTSIDDRHLEFNLSIYVFDKLVVHLQEVINGTF